MFAISFSGFHKFTGLSQAQKGWIYPARTLTGTTKKAYFELQGNHFHLDSPAEWAFQKRLPH